MTNVGEVTGSRTPSPAPIPWVSAVLPAPSGPTRTTRSPARSSSASSRPSAWVSAGVGQDVLALHGRLPRDGGQVGQQPGPRRAVRPEPDGRRRVVGRPDRPAVPGVRAAADLAEHGPRTEEPLRRRQPQRHDDRRVEQLELPAQPAAAARHLRRLRRPVARRTALHDVEDGGLRAVQAGLGEQLVEQRPGAADERPAGLVLRGAGRLPHAARSAAARMPGRRRRRRAAGRRRAQGRRRTSGRRRPGCPSRARRRRCGPPRRRRRPAAAVAGLPPPHPNEMTTGASAGRPCVGPFAPRVGTRREGRPP